MSKKIETPLCVVQMDTVFEALEITNPVIHDRLTNVLMLKNKHDGQMMINNDALYVWFDVPEVLYKDDKIEGTAIFRQDGSFRLMLSTLYSNTYRSVRRKIVFSGEDDFFQKSILDDIWVETYNESIEYKKRLDAIIVEYQKFFTDSFTWGFSDDKTTIF